MQVVMRAIRKNTAFLIGNLWDEALGAVDADHMAESVPSNVIPRLVKLLKINGQKFSR